MARLSIYKLLWWITVIGGVIKHYSYMLVPYIIAENPDIDGKEAIRLSQRMMDGRKMEAFLLDCSFIGWHILGYLTFGLVEGLWAVPYQTAAFTEFYADAREEAKDRAVEGCEYLNDRYLFTEASVDELKNAYADIEEQIGFVDSHRIELAPVNAFFAENFSIWLGSSAEKQRYDEVDSVHKQIEEDSKVINGDIYPQRLNPLWKNTSVEVVHSVRYLRTYTILSIIMIFFVFSFVGGMAAVYVLVPLIDTTLSRVNTKTLSMICMVLVVSFAADMVYSHYVPNTGEGITDYEAYKQTSGYQLVHGEEIYS